MARAKSNYRSTRSWIADHNERLTKEHAAIRVQLLLLCPQLDPAKLEAITCGYGDRSNPGLHDLLDAAHQLHKYSK